MGRVPKGVREILNVEITPDEIIYLIEEMARIHQERGEADIYTSFAILSDRYEQDKFGRTLCIMHRMRCFQPLLQDARMRGWSIEGIEPGCQHTHEAVFRAIAKCPLKATAKRMWFDPDEFFKMVLNETDAEGRA